MIEFIEHLVEILSGFDSLIQYLDRHPCADSLLFELILVTKLDDHSEFLYVDPLGKSLLESAPEIEVLAGLHLLLFDMGNVQKIAVGFIPNWEVLLSLPFS